MKTLITISLTLVAFLCVTPATSQQNLKALMDRAEKEPRTHLVVVMERNGPNKEKSAVTKALTIQNHKALVAEFLEAFARDKDNADKVVETSKDGKTIPSVYTFSEGEKTIVYIFYQKNDSEAYITSIERPKDYDPQEKVRRDIELNIGSNVKMSMSGMEFNLDEVMNLVEMAQGKVSDAELLLKNMSIQIRNGSTDSSAKVVIKNQ